MRTAEQLTVRSDTRKCFDEKWHRSVYEGIRSRDKHQACNFIDVFQIRPRSRHGTRARFSGRYGEGKRRRGAVVQAAANKLADLSRRYILFWLLLEAFLAICYSFCFYNVKIGLSKMLAAAPSLRSLGRSSWTDRSQGYLERPLYRHGPRNLSWPSSISLPSSFLVRQFLCNNVFSHDATQYNLHLLP